MRSGSPRSRRAAMLAAPIVATMLAACAGGPAATGPTATSAPVVEVAVRDYAFDPSAISVAPGAVTFRIENVGGEEHEFEILRGDAVVDEVEGLVPGLTKDLTVTLEAGDYTFVCKLADHEQRGMTGTLTVAPS